MAKKSEITVKDVRIRTMKVNGADYICITDIARQTVGWGNQCHSTDASA